MWSLRKKLQRLIKDFDADVIITTGQYEKFALASIPVGKHRVKVREYHFNSDYRRFLIARGIKKLFYSFLGVLDNRITNLFFDACYLLTQKDKVENFGQNHRYDFMPNPVTLDKAETSPRFESRHNNVIAVGRLVSAKNFMALVRVWEQIYKKHPGWTLEIAGGGDTAPYESYIGKNNIERIHFLGFRKDISELLDDAKIFTMTSLYEGFGLAIVEAMSRGVVPVSFDTPNGPSDIINDGRDGILVDYLDEEQFAEKLSALMSDTQKQQTLSAAATERAHDFDIDVIIAQWMEKYRNLLNKKAQK